MSRAPEPARTGRDRLGKTIAQMRRTRSGTPWRLRNWSLRTKLIAVLLIPTLTALVLIGLHFNTQLRAANNLSELSARVTADRALAGLVHALQRERDLTVRFVANGRKADDETEFAEQRRRVNARLGTFSEVYNAVKPKMSDPAVKDLEQVRKELGGLPRLRYGAQHDKYPANKVLSGYGSLISDILAARGRTVAGVSEPELVRLQLATTAVSRIKDQLSITRGLVDEALVVGKLSVDLRRELAGANSDLEAWRSEFETFATPEQERMYDDKVTGTLVDQRNDMLDTVVARSENGRSLQGIDRAQWDTASTYMANLVFEVEQALQAQMQERTDALADQARTSALRDGAIVLALLTIAALLAVVIGRSLIRPLRTLRSTALEVAEYRLPAAVHGLLANPRNPRKTDVAPVPVDSTEEVGQVARAFDAVHGEAVRLAGEQAELRQNVNAMFLNLARRGQELAERQLDVLDGMEADEQDPDVLAKLFELDHLATRSRRVAENLLVLTGNDFARMLPGSIPASEVMAASLSEIEHYQRVQLSTIPEIAVRGDAVGDVVHVISELLENATNESEDEPVSVVSSITREGCWKVEITDSGEGMTDEEIDRANARLADPPEIDVEASRRMGLYVVARLAKRNGLEVRLRHAPTGGLTAVVIVPARLIGEMPPTGTRRTEEDDPNRPLDWLETASRRQAVREARTARTKGTSRPPRVAPIEKRRPDPELVPGHPLEEDGPTERMPAYRDLLSKWFEQVQTGLRDRDGGDEQEDSADSGEDFEVLTEADMAAAAQAAERRTEKRRAATEPPTKPEYQPASVSTSSDSQDDRQEADPDAPTRRQREPVRTSARSESSGPELDSRTVRMTRRQHAAIEVSAQLAAAEGKPAPTNGSPHGDNDRTVRQHTGSSNGSAHGTASNGASRGNSGAARGNGSSGVGRGNDSSGAARGSSGSAHGNGSANGATRGSGSSGADRDHTARRGTPNGSNGTNGSNERQTAATVRSRPISRAPEAVRGRMKSLAEGRRRARQPRRDEYAESGQPATVGSPRQSWPASRPGTGGEKEG